MQLRRLLLNLSTFLKFPGSPAYWDKRYREGGDSGAGSYGAEAAYKAKFLDELLDRHDVRDIVDFGCGDGNQIAGLRQIPYLGFDISPAAVERCRVRYADDRAKRFLPLSDYAGERADLSMSLDVLYHLVEAPIFDDYLQRLFAASQRLVVIYAVDADEAFGLHGRHVRYRQFTTIIAERFPEFRLVDTPARPGNLPGAAESAASFFVYLKSV